MKKFLMAICCLALVAALCGGALADLSNLQIPTLDEMLVSHRVLQSAQNDEYEEYLVLFYAEGSHVIKQINDEMHFDKSTGITADLIRSMDLSEFYPGYNDMDFADSLITDGGSYISLVIRFKNLDYLANMDKMKQYGILSDDPNDQVYDADFLVRMFEADGMRELSVSEYGGKGLNFTVE